MRPLEPRPPVGASRRLACQRHRQTRKRPLPTGKAHLQPFSSRARAVDKGGAPISIATEDDKLSVQPEHFDALVVAV